jgi:hypothetical protein
MHYSITPDDIKSEIEILGHKVSNIWNIKHPQTKQPRWLFGLFFINLLPAPNNKDIFNVQYLQQCKIQFEPSRHKREIAQCTNCQRYGHTKNYFHLQPRCVKCAGNHPTQHCLQKDRSNEVRCVLCDGNHPANYKGCTVYKKLQHLTYPPLRTKQYTPPALIQQTKHVQPGLSYAHITSQHLSPYPTPAPAPPATKRHPRPQILLQKLFEQMGTIINLLTTFITKLK